MTPNAPPTPTAHARRGNEVGGRTVRDDQRARRNILERPTIAVAQEGLRVHWMVGPLQRVGSSCAHKRSQVERLHVWARVIAEMQPAAHKAVDVQVAYRRRSVAESKPWQSPDHQGQ